MAKFHHIWLCPLIGAFFVLAGCAPDLWRIEQATVRLDDRLGVGTGVLVRADLALTARHVVAGGWPQKVTFTDRSWVMATTVWRSEKYDLALVQLDKPVSRPVVRFGCTRPKIGERLVAIGTPLGLGWVAAWGRVGSERVYDQLGSEYQVITMTVAKGMSGAGVFDRQGYVRGLVKAGAPMMLFVVAADVVCAEVLPQIAKIEVAE